MADESNQLRVRLVTPERTLFEHAATAVELPSKSGYMEVLLRPRSTPGRAGRWRRYRPLRAGERLLTRTSAVPRANPATTSVGDLLKSCPVASPFSPPTRSSPRRSTSSAPSSSSIAARRCGMKPAKAKKPTTRLSASSPKPKPKSLRPLKLPSRTKSDSLDALQQKALFASRAF